jgi:hypothetical protein
MPESKSCKWGPAALGSGHSQRGLRREVRFAVDQATTAGAGPGGAAARRSGLAAGRRNPLRRRPRIGRARGGFPARGRRCARFPRSRGSPGHGSRWARSGGRVQPRSVPLLSAGPCRSRGFERGGRPLCLPARSPGRCARREPRARAATRLHLVQLPVGAGTDRHVPGGRSPRAGSALLSHRQLLPLHRVDPPPFRSIGGACRLSFPEVSHVSGNRGVRIAPLPQ